VDERCITKNEKQKDLELSLEGECIVVDSSSGTAKQKFNNQSI